MCLPHACGGVSRARRARRAPAESSPRMWGCLRVPRSVFFDINVFPTHVVVFPLQQAREPFDISLPHACGGVSLRLTILGGSNPSSPRMWGCFHFPRLRLPSAPVFPTHVGAIFKPYNLPTPRLPCSRPYPARTAGRATPANAGFGKALSNHPATGNPPRRSCGKSGVWAAWLQALPVPAFRAGAEASLPVWAARRAFLPLRPAPHVGR